ncbi:MAG: selenocysteine-specific translation elongation factor [Dehalococcoidia bacterium]|nr:selenocysteine-specific translation elongation factor [Dehalococcoidia bacterium]
MYVIGTAGHVDHGKSTLVKALTGIDPDRLKEEKEREMTIDLGFAWLSLPGGEEVGVIDVPGHERLVKNMLAGIGGIDLAMLIVAADEGVAPQTREHLAILDLLRLTHGIVVLTKRDLVDADWLELVTADVQEVLKGMSLAGAPIVAVSSATGQGLDDLKRLLAATLRQTPPRPDLGRPRLAIDRSFVVAGFGTVVTGTLVDGAFHLGQEVEIVPKGLRARIRGLQSHQKKLDEAGPGRRLAVNLTGVNHDQLVRGDVVTLPGWLVPTQALDAKLRLVAGAPPVRHNAPVSFHSGAAETLARLRLLDADEASGGQSVWAQVKLEQPAAVVKGDLFILRNAWGTIGGGQVIEPHAKRHQRRHAGTLERLAVMETGAPEEIVLAAVAAREPCAARAVAEATGLALDAVQRILEGLAQSGQAIRFGDAPAALYFSRAGFERASAKARQALADFHTRFPLRAGMPREELRSRLDLPPPVFIAALARLVASGAVAEESSLVRLPGHAPRLTAAQQRAVDVYLAALAASPYSPPSDISIEPEALAYLLDVAKVVRAAPDVVFAAAAYDQMVDKVKAHIAQHGKITVAEVRDLFGTSRKYALALMEYLDQQRITRRVGDERVLR